MLKQPRRGYVPIPPPPLPQFYLPPKAHHQNISAATTAYNAAQAKFVAISGRRVYKSINSKLQTEELILGHRPEATPGNNEARDHSYDQRESGRSRQPKARVQIPTGCNDIAPMAIYHICRICLRPRSTTFHQENPIPLNGVPPPPGICRRCRIAPVEEMAKVTGIVRQCKSNDVKLGVKCAVPDQYIYSHRELEALRGRCEKAERFGGKNAQSHAQRDLRYRHVEVEATRAPPENSSEDERHESRHIRRQPMLEISDRKTQKPSSGSEGGRGDRTDSDIRRIAREEVDRYRQAERKLQAHPDPFAHGRLIPAMHDTIREKVKSGWSSRTQPPVSGVTHSQHKHVLDSCTELKHRARCEGNRSYRFINSKSHPPLNESHQTQYRTVPLATNLAEKHLASSRKDTSLPNMPKDEPSVYIKLREVPGISEQMKRSRPRRQDSKLDLQDDLPANSNNFVRVPSGDELSGSHLSALSAHHNLQRTASVKANAEPEKESCLPEHSKDVKNNLGHQKWRDPHHSHVRQYGNEHSHYQSNQSAEDDYMLRNCVRYKYPNREARNSDPKVVGSDQSGGQDRLPERNAVDRTADLKGAQDISHGDESGCDDGNLVKDYNIKPTSQRFHKYEAVPKGDLSACNLHYPPYPEDGSELVPMPSPSVRSTRARPTSNSKLETSSSNSGPSEYFYMERTTQPVGHRGDSHMHNKSPSSYYLEKKELLVRGRPPLAGTHRRSANTTLREQVLRAGEGLSHVSFSTAVDISPTPPRSDASSEQFQDFSKKLRYRTDDRNHTYQYKNLSEEKGHRRRLNNRSHDFANKIHPVNSAEHKDQSHHRVDRADSRTSQVNSTRSRSSGTDAVPSRRPLNQALSESPSRENLRSAAHAAQTPDARPPYRRYDAPGTSLVAECGSDEEPEKIEREFGPRSYHPQGGRRLHH